jgi:four helix bundle protein
MEKNENYQVYFGKNQINIKTLYYMTIDNLEIYILSIRIGENVWGIVIKWDYFARDTVGKQLVRAADSVAANISEGYGRFHFKEEKQFLFYARGSLFEPRTFVNQAHSRKLISDQSYIELNEKIILLLKKLNSFINSINSKLNH